MHVAYAHLVFTDICERGTADVNGDVGGDVVCRIVHLVKELFRYTLTADEPSAVRRFGDDKIIVADLGDGEAELIHVRDGAPVILEVAAGTLTAALKQMSRHYAAREIIPVTILPPHAVCKGGKEQGRVCRASGQNSVCAHAEAVHDRLAPIVDVRINYFVLDVIKAADSVHILELDALCRKLRNAVKQVIAENITDFIAAKPLALYHLLELIHTCGDVHAAGVCEDTHFLLVGFLRDYVHKLQKVSCVTGLGVLQFLTLHDRQR